MNQLKDAEKKASADVSKARDARTARMKEAKSEADKLVAKHKQEKETQYQVLVNQQSAITASGNSLDSEANHEIAVLTRDFNAKKSSVAQTLVDLVVRVDIKPPPPARV